VESFNGWTKKNRLLLNTTKTKELVVDLRRSKTPCQSVCIDGGEIETVQTCKYLGVVSQFSHPAISNFPLILPLPHSACQPHPPRQLTPLTCAHSCLSSHAISPAYSHQLHTLPDCYLPCKSFQRSLPVFPVPSSLVLDSALRLPPGNST